MITTLIIIRLNGAGHEMAGPKSGCGAEVTFGRIALSRKERHGSK
ncbi:MAG: hypothetical protein V2B18_16450 [Pseudomonadota bacterium]